MPLLGGWWNSQDIRRSRSSSISLHLNFSAPIADIPRRKNLLAWAVPAPKFHHNLQFDISVSASLSDAPRGTFSCRSICTPKMQSDIWSSGMGTSCHAHRHVCRTDGKARTQHQDHWQVVGELHCVEISRQPAGTRGKYLFRLYSRIDHTIGPSSRRSSGSRAQCRGKWCKQNRCYWACSVTCTWQAYLFWESEFCDTWWQRFGSSVTSKVYGEIGVTTSEKKPGRHPSRADCAIFPSNTNCTTPGPRRPSYWCATTM